MNRETQPESGEKMSHEELVQYLKENRELSLLNMTELVNHRISLPEVISALAEIEN